MVGRVPDPVQQPQEADRLDTLELLFLLEHVDLGEARRNSPDPQGLAGLRTGAWAGQEREKEKD